MTTNGSGETAGENLKHMRKMVIEFGKKGDHYIMAVSLTRLRPL